MRKLYVVLRHGTTVKFDEQRCVFLVVRRASKRLFAGPVKFSLHDNDVLPLNEILK